MSWFAKRTFIFGYMHCHSKMHKTCLLQSGNIVFQNRTFELGCYTYTSHNVYYVKFAIKFLSASLLTDRVRHALRLTHEPNYQPTRDAVIDQRLDD